MVLKKIGRGKLVYRDQEGNVIIGIFDNHNKRGTHYGTIYLTALQGNFKQTFQVSIPEFYKLLKLIERMPVIEKKIKEKRKKK